MDREGGGEFEAEVVVVAVVTSVKPYLGALPEEYIIGA